MRNDNSEDIYSLQSTSSASPGLYLNTNVGGKSRSSLVRIPNQRIRNVDTPNNEEISSSYSKAEFRFYSRSREDTQIQPKVSRRGHPSVEKVFSRPDFVVSDCWKANSREIPVKLIQLLEDNVDEDNRNIPIKRRRVFSDEDNDGLNYTKEFHVLTEVQKAKILTVVEDTIKKLANKDLRDYGEKLEEISLEKPTFNTPSISAEQFCKVFLPWIIMKVVEMVLCHIIQLTFLSEASYFKRKEEFLPIVVTYYLTLFIIVFSLMLHTTCFSYKALRNPCYIMSIVSCSILTLTTTLGMLIMLISIKYHKSFQQILVLVFIACLLCSLFVEFCLSYFEVKHIWKRMELTRQTFLA